MAARLDPIGFGIKPRYLKFLLLKVPANHLSRAPGH